MKNLNLGREEFLKDSMETLGNIYDNMTNLKNLDLGELVPNKTALVIIDMVNGFAREGALKSSRVEGIIEPIAGLMRRCREKGIVQIAFADNHCPDTIEFGAYPQHCLEGTSEAEIVDELKTEGGYTLIPKNSTNGFLEKDFEKWLLSNNDIDTFLIVGDCTDICIMQFALTIKTWFNKENKPSRIIVPADMVETYDLGDHKGDFLNIMALQIMQWNGIEIVEEIR